MENEGVGDEPLETVAFDRLSADATAAVLQ